MSAGVVVTFHQHLDWLRLQLEAVRHTCGPDVPVLVVADGPPLADWADRIGEGFPGVGTYTFPDRLGLQAGDKRSAYHGLRELLESGLDVVAKLSTRMLCLEPGWLQRAERRLSGFGDGLLAAPWGRDHENRFDLPVSTWRAVRSEAFCIRGEAALRLVEPPFPDRAFENHLVERAAQHKVHICPWPELEGYRDRPCPANGERYVYHRPVSMVQEAFRQAGVSGKWTDRLLSDPASLALPTCDGVAWEKRCRAWQVREALRPRESARIPSYVADLAANRSRGDIQPHLPLIAALAHAAPGDRCVELGVRGAQSTRAILAATRDSRPPKRLWSLDTADCARVVAALQKSPDGGRWTFLQRDSADTNGLSDGPIGFLLMDACHDLEGLQREWAAWWPRVQSGGLVTVHDVASHPGAYQFAEWLGRGVRIDNCNGLLIVQKGDRDNG